MPIDETRPYGDAVEAVDEMIEDATEASDEDFIAGIPASDFIAGEPVTGDASDASEEDFIAGEPVIGDASEEFEEDFEENLGRNRT